MIRHTADRAQTNTICSSVDPWHEGAVVTGDRIYIGFQSKDPDQRHIFIQTMRRDETMGRDGATKTDDTVSIILDTYGIRLTGFFHAGRSDRSGAPLDVPALAGHAGSRILVSQEIELVFSKRRIKSVRGQS